MSVYNLLLLYPIGNPQSPSVTVPRRRKLICASHVPVGGRSKTAPTYSNVHPKATIILIAHSAFLHSAQGECCQRQQRGASGGFCILNSALICNFFKTASDIRLCRNSRHGAFLFCRTASSSCSFAQTASTAGLRPRLLCRFRPRSCACALPQ